MIIRDYGTIVPSVMTVIFGLALIIFVFLGCCGVCRESTCCMETYSAFLILLALSHFALGAYCTMVYYNGKHGNLERQIQNDLTSRVANYKYKASPMDDVQKWLKCCGVKRPEQEYEDLDKFSPNGNQLPATCCDNLLICNYDSSDRYYKNCLSSVYELTIYTNVIIGFVSLGIGAVELIAALLGICLSCCIWRNRSVAVWR
ncbi:unnamed protein product [Phaedon cochleariae]|nr:unnamed protein product [Phaedon cochleariae]